MRILYLPIFLIFISLTSLYSQDNKTSELFNKTLEELMSLQVVSSSFTDIDNRRVPAATTVITDEEIALTPARNLLDILEIFVPGSLWMVHYDGPHPAIRGIVEERNFKVLLLVNGKNMNQKIRNGATSELENWDLSDIKKIEVIRGPGSVIYGPGAIEAVINITTKRYTVDNIQANVNTVYPYKSYGANFSYSKSFSKDIKLYSFFSVTTTKGLIPADGYYFAGNEYFGDVHYWEDTIKRPLQDLYQDTDLNPQVKVHLQLDFGENTSVWARYTNSGTAVNGITLKSSYQTGFDSTGFLILGPYVNFNQTKDQHFTVTFDNKYIYNENISLHSLLAFNSENSSRSQDYIQQHPLQYAPSNPEIMKQLEDPNSLRNRYFACSENEINLISTLKRKFSSDFSSAFGIEYSYNFWGKSWFMPDYYLRLGDRWNILTDKNSPAYGYKLFFGTDSADTYFVGNGWYTNTFSIFSEANYEPRNDMTLLLSARVDKNDYSDWLFSPRVAFIWEIFEEHYFKLIAQRSLRMNTAEELLILNLENHKPQSEKIDNIELIVTKMIGANSLFNLSTFISWMDILSWNDPMRSTVLSGKLNIWGIEFDAEYYVNNFNFVFNHAFYKQISWKLQPGIFESGISYSDYYKEYFGAILQGTGNDLNNISKNTTKFAFNWKIIENKLTLHIDSRIYWGFDGAKDGITMMKNAIPFSSDSTSMKGIIALIEKYDTYGIDARINASVKYYFFNNFEFTLYGMNLIDLTKNKRLRYDTGSKEERFHYIMKNGLIVEPLTIGLKLSYKY